VCAYTYNNCYYLLVLLGTHYVHTRTRLVQFPKYERFSCCRVIGRRRRRPLRPRKDVCMYGVQYIIIIMKIIILFYRHRYYIILLYTMRYDNNNIIYLNGGGQPPRAPQPTVFNDAGGGRRDGSARDAVMSWSSRLGRPTCHARQAIRHTAPDRTYAHVVAVAASVRFRIDNNISYRYSLVVGTSLFRFRSPSSP